MRKLLLLAGIFTVLAYNAQARYYEENGYDYEEQPRYEQRRVRYRDEPQYERQVRYREEPRFTRKSPQYRRISREEEREYNERRYVANNSNTIRPYIGLDVAASSMKFGKDPNKKWLDDYYEEPAPFKKTLDKDHSAINFVLGTKFNKYFGIEAFYEISDKKDTSESYTDDPDMYTDNYKGSIKYHAVGLDFQGYLPISQEFELLASLGLGEYYFETKGQLFEDQYGWYDEELNIWQANNNSLGIRFGLGAQYNINEHVALRAMARYVHMTDDEYIKSLTEFSLGLRYMF